MFISSQVSFYLFQRNVHASAPDWENIWLFINQLIGDADAKGATIEAEPRALKYILFVRVCRPDAFLHRMFNKIEHIEASILFMHPRQGQG
jgi:hypothetical protein